MKRIFTFLFFLSFVMASAFAQERRIQNKPFIDERRFHYGFYIGLHDQGLGLQTNGFIDPATQQQWMIQTDRHNWGFSVGVLGEWKLHKNLGLRVLPGLHFGSKHLRMKELNEGTWHSQEMRTCYIGAAIDLKAAAPRYNNFRPYVIAGVQPLYDLTTKKQAEVRMKPFQMMLEAGMGCDLYMPFFKFIPELKFCFGLGNILKKSRPDLMDPTQLIYTQSIERATASMFVLTFYFE